ncbi:hypothetical protein LINGRAHAP2_LOCUS24175 [Linum grandiflorum]
MPDTVALSPASPAAPPAGSLPATSATKTWASILAPSADLKVIDLTPDFFSDGALMIPQEVLAPGKQRLKAALVAQFLGPIPPLRVFAAMAHRLWGFEGLDVKICILLKGTKCPESIDLVVEDGDRVQLLVSCSETRTYTKAPVWRRKQPAATAVTKPQDGVTECLFSQC